jgi:hypothetical protein
MHVVLALGSAAGVALAIGALILLGVAARAILGRPRRPRMTDPTVTDPTGTPTLPVGDGPEFKPPPDQADG